MKARMGLFGLLGICVSGCASYEHVIGEGRARNVRIEDRVIRRLETKVDVQPPRPEEPDLRIRVREEAVEQQVRVRTFTRIVRIRKVEARLSWGAHAIIWTVGWLAGGPIVWYPVLGLRAEEEAEYHAKNADSFHQSFHPWEIRQEDVERAEGEKEEILRRLGPARILESRNVPGVPIRVRFLDHASGGLTLEGRTGRDGTARFNLQAVVREHVLQAGLKPIRMQIEAGEGKGRRIIESGLGEKELVAAYQGSSIDWSVGAVKGRGDPAADVYLNKLRFERGETPVLELSLVNRGRGPLYRFWARVTSSAFPGRTKPLFVGRVAPGQVVDRSIELWELPAGMEPGEYEVRVEFREYRGDVPEPRTIRFTVR